MHPDVWAQSTAHSLVPCLDKFPHLTHLWILIDFILYLSILFLSVFDGAPVANCIVMDLMEVVLLAAVWRGRNIHFLVCEVLLLGSSGPVGPPYDLLWRTQVVLRSLLLEHLLLPLELFLLLQGRSLEKVFLLFIVHVPKTHCWVIPVVPGGWPALICRCDLPAR